VCQIKTASAFICVHLHQWTMPFTRLSIGKNFKIVWRLCNLLFHKCMGASSQAHAWRSGFSWQIIPCLTIDLFIKILMTVFRFFKFFNMHPCKCVRECWPFFVIIHVKLNRCYVKNNYTLKYGVDNCNNMFAKIMTHYLRRWSIFKYQLCTLIVTFWFLNN